MTECRDTFSWRLYPPEKQEAIAYNHAKKKKID